MLLFVMLYFIHTQKFYDANIYFIVSIDITCYATNFTTHGKELEEKKSIFDMVLLE